MVAGFAQRRVWAQHVQVWEDRCCVLEAAHMSVVGAQAHVCTTAPDTSSTRGASTNLDRLAVANARDAAVDEVGAGSPPRRLAPRYAAGADTGGQLNKGWHHGHDPATSHVRHVRRQRQTAELPCSTETINPKPSTPKHPK